MAEYIACLRQVKKKKLNQMTDTTVFVVDEGERQPWSETEWISPPIIIVHVRSTFKISFLLIYQCFLKITAI
jgi:hypothetical protein